MTNQQISRTFPADIISAAVLKKKLRRKGHKKFSVITVYADGDSQ
jgi:hypothetical protein